MSQVTKKLQVTIPKASSRQRLSTAERLRLFDDATARQRAREAHNPPAGEIADRGWTREDLYTADVGDEPRAS